MIAPAKIANWIPICKLLINSSPGIYGKTIVNIPMYRTNPMMVNNDDITMDLPFL